MQKMYSFFKKKGTTTFEDIFIQIIKSDDTFEKESFRIENGEIIDLSIMVISVQDYENILNNPNVLTIPPIVYFKSKKEL